LAISAKELQLQKFEHEAMTHLDALMRTATKLTHNRTDAEDIVQETYLRAWKYFASFEAGSNIRAWLFRIMFNVINFREGKKTKLAETSLEDEERSLEYERNNVIAFDPLKQIEGRELLEATKQLSEEYRAVLWLVVVEEFSYKEAAEILGVPIGTVMSRLHRARRDLRKLMLTDKATGTSN
jgi:RNA polymerase sigma-70 factor, ECF subfamily